MFEEYQKLVALGKRLGLDVPKGTKLDALRPQVATRITEVLAGKGIVNGVTIRYDDEAGTHAGKRAEVVDTEVSWNLNIPFVTLRHEGTHKAHTFLAEPVVFHADVVR